MTVPTTSASSGSPSPFAVFRSRNFSLMWSAQLISTIGDALATIAASIVIYRMTGSAAGVALMLLVTALPSLGLGLFAGVVVDRYDRRRIMMAVDLTRALLVVLIPTLAARNIAWLYIIIFLMTVVEQFFDPAHESLLPDVASDEDLAAANSMMAISAFGSTAVGFAAAGFLAEFAGIDLAFYLDSLTFLISVVCLYFVRVDPVKADEQTRAANVVQNLKAGIYWVRDTPVLRSLLLISVPMLIGFGLANSLLLPFASRALHASEAQYGIQEGMTSVGFTIGAFLMAGIFNRMREGPWIAISLIGMAIVGIAYTFNSSVPVAILLLTISGFFNAPYSIGRRLVVQRNTPREMRGRVNSAFFVARDSLFIIGIGAAALADIIDVRMMYLISSVLVLVAGIWVLVIPGLRQESSEWKRALSLLRRAPSAPRLGVGRPATTADLDSLVARLPPLASLSATERRDLVEESSIFDATSGDIVLRQGETGDEAYFVLEGRLVAGFTDKGGEDRYLSTMTAGDFFGEIAALKASQRTANVVAENDSTLYQISGDTLHQLMDNPAMSEIVLTKITERLNRSNLGDLPKMGGYDQEALRGLRSRTTEPQPITT